jgi:hypothetical protein
MVHLASGIIIVPSNELINKKSLNSNPITKAGLTNFTVASYYNSELGTFFASTCFSPLSYVFSNSMLKLLDLSNSIVGP